MSDQEMGAICVIAGLILALAVVGYALGLVAFLAGVAILLISFGLALS